MMTWLRSIVLKLFITCRSLLLLFGAVLFSFLPSSIHIANYVSTTVGLAGPANNDAQMKLGEISEISGKVRNALKLVYKGVFSSFLFSFLVYLMHTFTAIHSREKCKITSGPTGKPAPQPLSPSSLKRNPQTPLKPN